MVTESVQDVHSCAEIIASKLPSGLSRTAVRLYTALVGAAIETMRRKGYSANTTHMTIHAPVEQLAQAVGVSRQSVWRHLPALKALGVVDWRVHKGTCRGATRNTGTVFQVRLNPLAGRACRLSYQDLKHKWRPNFDREVRTGRTSYRALKHTKAQASNEIDISVITDWLSFSTTNKAPVKDVCNKAQRLTLESLFDVRFAAKQEQGKAVDAAAQALAQALADSRSVDFYRRIVWAACRASQGTMDYLQIIYTQATRAAVDRQEVFARKAGALFCARLKQAGILDELMRT